MGPDGASVRIGQRTWKSEVKAVVAERDDENGMRRWEIRVLEKYMGKEEKKCEEWLDNEEGRTVFNIRAGSLGLRNRTGRTAQDRSCHKCTEGRLK